MIRDAAAFSLGLTAVRRLGKWKTRWQGTEVSTGILSGVELWVAPPGTGSALTTGGVLLASSGQRPGMLSKVLPAQESLHHVVIWPKRQCGCRSVPQLCPTLCDPMDCSTPGFLSVTISWTLLRLMSVESVMPSNRLILSSPSSPAFSLSQHQGLFQ